MKRFRVSYFLEDHVRTENIFKDFNITAEQIYDEQLVKITTNSFLRICSKQGTDRLDTSLIRYIRVSGLND